MRNIRKRICFGPVLLLCLLLFSGLAVRASENKRWTEADLSDILPGEKVAITITHAGHTYILGSGNGSSKAPDARAVTVENGQLLCSDGDIYWTVSQEEGYVRFCPAGGDGWLYTHNGNDSLRVGDGEDARWSLSGGTILHRTTQRYLRVDTEGGIWQAKKSPAQGQTLQFWHQTTLETEAPPVTGAATPETKPSLSQEETTAPTAEPEASPTNPSIPATEPASPTEPALSPTEPAQAAESPAGLDTNYNFYFGQLHAHTDISDGVASVEEAFRYASRVNNLDFFAVTDHSDSFDNANLGQINEDGTILSRDFAAGKAAAAAVTGEDFVGIYGFEMSWPQGKHLGHIGTFATPGWQSWKQEEFSTLESYYAALAKVPGAIGQFNHPGESYGNFENFAHYDAAYDEQMALLEVGGVGGSRAYGAYTQALDAGWHVAPTSSHNDHRGHFGDAGQSRTVILAKELTEEALYEAMRERRVYASDDGDLQICYRLNGHIMGTIAGPVSAPKAQIQLFDPTDGAIGYVEVVADGGTVLASQTVSKNRAELTLSLASGYSYYYLRITQADGDIAVTAPVWTDSLQDLGIGSFTASTALPIQGKALSLEVTLFNNEAEAMTVDFISFSAGGVPVHTVQSPGTVNPRDTLTYHVPYTHDGLGVTEFSVQVSATVAGQAMQWERSLTLSYRAPEQTADILVDGCHGNFGTGSLSRFTAIAAEANMDVATVTGPLPAGGSLLLITAPASKFEKSYIQEVRSFLQNGGTVLLCGHAGKADALNTLLSGVGSTLRLGEKLANSACACLYNENASLTSGLKKKQIFHHSGGCAIDPGEGTWLVKDPETGSVMLAREDLPQGGTIIAAGSLFLTDKCLPVPAGHWDPASANQSVLEAILGVEKTEMPVSTIAQARAGQPEEVFRIRGYVTAGTSADRQDFPDTLCLQDSTGGIPIVSFSDPGIQVGTPLEVTGYRDSQNGNTVLKLITYEILEGDFYRFVPQTIPCEKAMDYARRGGRLLQVQGKVKGITLNDDGSGISRLILKDEDDGLATVVIEQENTLATQIKKGRTVRAAGILFLDENGESVLRVRNPGEVVYVPPNTIIPDGANPKTGDPLFLPVWLTVLSGAALLPLRQRKR